MNNDSQNEQQENNDFDKELYDFVGKINMLIEQTDILIDESMPDQPFSDKSDFISPDIRKINREYIHKIFSKDKSNANCLLAKFNTFIDELNQIENTQNDNKLMSLAKLITENNFLNIYADFLFNILKEQKELYRYFEIGSFLKIMIDDSLLATAEHFLNVFEAWKPIMFNRNNIKICNIIQNIKNVTKLSCDILFSKEQRNEILNSKLKINNIFKNESVEEDTRSNIRYLFPFLCHLYVDYDDNIIKPLKLIKILGSIDDNFNKELYRYYGASYIWELLQKSENKLKDNELLPIYKENQKLEAEIIFSEETIKKEIILTDIICIQKSEIPKDQIMKMINFILSGGKDNFINFLKIGSSNNNEFFILISKICDYILKYVKVQNKELIPNYFKTICKIASSPNFRGVSSHSDGHPYNQKENAVTSNSKDKSSNFKCISFLIQLLIDFYYEFQESQTEITINIDPETKSQFLQFIILGPPFFSFPKSRDNKKKFLQSFLKESKKNIKKDTIELNQDHFCYACYPSIILKDNPEAFKEFTETIQYKISAIIENEDILKDEKDKSNSLNENEQIKTSIKNKVNFKFSIFNFELMLESRINEKSLEILSQLTPFILFQEAKIGQPPEKNECGFHKELREKLSRNDTLSSEISKKLSDKYLRRKFDIFNNKNLKNLKNLFDWYLIQFLIAINDSTVILRVDEKDQKCKRKYIKFFIKSRPPENRDHDLCSLFRYKNGDILIKSIEPKVKSYCSEFNLMYSEIELISKDDLMDKLNIIIAYLSNSLQMLLPNSAETQSNSNIKKSDEKSRAIEILELAINHIKYKTESQGKQSTLLNQMCKKIFNAFDDSMKLGTKENENDKFILELFTSFAYESINIIPTKTALKKITKILRNLKTQQSKIVIVSLFNFFDSKLSQREIILQITKKDLINMAKQKVIEKNEGHLYRFNSNVCFDCKRKVTYDFNIGYVQFFSCGHMFHTFNCTGFKNKIFYRKCPICPVKKSKAKKKKKSNEIVTLKKPSFDNYFNSKDNRFHSSLESINTMLDSMMFPTCISSPPISVKVNYNEVDSFFESNDDIIISISDNEIL